MRSRCFWNMLNADRNLASALSETLWKKKKKQNSPVPDESAHRQHPCESAEQNQVLQTWEMEKLFFFKNDEKWKMSFNKQFDKL